MNGKPLVIIIGPTAVGKTAIAIQLAQALNGEIINADSRQIYRYMDIGTAKPTLEQRAQVPHHLVDCFDPDYQLGVAEYQDRAYSVIADVHQRGKIPFLVGGTGQYITAIEEGWVIPRVPPSIELRQELEAFANQHGPHALHNRLRDLDPTAAENIHPNNIRRVIRALEVCLLTGQPISRLQQKRPPNWDIRRLGFTLPRNTLYEQADKRVDDMIAKGFLEEVQKLLAMGYPQTLPSMSGLGYAELCAHLNGELTLDEAIMRTKFNTHDFIRRQYVWFRGHNNGIMWHNVQDLDLDTLIASSENWLLGLG